MAIGDIMQYGYWEDLELGDINPKTTGKATGHNVLSYNNKKYIRIAELSEISGMDQEEVEWIECRVRNKIAYVSRAFTFYNITPKQAIEYCNKYRYIIDGSEYVCTFLSLEEFESLQREVVSKLFIDDQYAYLTSTVSHQYLGQTYYKTIRTDNRDFFYFQYIREDQYDEKTHFIPVLIKVSDDLETLRWGVWAEHFRYNSVWHVHYHGSEEKNPILSYAGYEDEGYNSVSSIDLIDRLSISTFHKDSCTDLEWFKFNYNGKSAYIAKNIFISNLYKDDLIERYNNKYLNVRGKPFVMKVLSSEEYKKIPSNIIKQTYIPTDYYICTSSNVIKRSDNTFIDVDFINGPAYMYVPVLVSCDMYSDNEIVKMGVLRNIHEGNIVDIPQTLSQIFANVPFVEATYRHRNGCINSIFGIYEQIIFVDTDDDSKKWAWIKTTLPNGKTIFISTTFGPAYYLHPLAEINVTLNGQDYILRNLTKNEWLSIDESVLEMIDFGNPSDGTPHSIKMHTITRTSSNDTVGNYYDFLRQYSDDEYDAWINNTSNYSDELFECMSFVSNSKAIFNNWTKGWEYASPARPNNASLNVYWIPVLELKNVPPIIDLPDKYNDDPTVDI